jgi:hypothetical protein
MGLCESPHLLKVVLSIPEKSGCRCACETLANQGANNSDLAGCKPCHLAHWTVLLALTSGTHEICRALTTGWAAISPESIFESEQLSLSVPEIVASQTGDLVVADAGYVWCLTRDLPGFHPEARDADIYLVLTEGLARFHSIMRALPLSGPSQVPDGICVRTRQSIDRLAA